MISPFARNSGSAPLVDHTLFDHTSILKLIEWRWKLAPLTPRDASPQIGNLAAALNFSTPNSTVPAIPVPSSVVLAPCFENILGVLSAAAPSSPTRRPTTGTALALSPGVAQWSREGRLPR